MIKALTAALTLAALASPALAAERMQPGLWEYQSAGFGSTGSTERKCLTAEDIDKLFAGFSNRHYACTYPVHEASGGKWRFRGTCTSRKHAEQKGDVEWSGAYAAEAFDLKGHVDAPVFGGLVLPIAASITAKRVGPTCTAADETK